MRTTTITTRFLVAAILVLATRSSADEIRFTKKVLTNKYYCDGVASGDINADGKLDIVAGPFWYEGPEFDKAHTFYEPIPLKPEVSPSNSMFSFLHDFSGDGKLDILVLGRVHKHEAKWYENPGDTSKTWKSHFAFERVRGESPTMADLNGDGTPQLICHWEGRWGWISPNRKDCYAPWEFTSIGENEDWPQFYHGEGVGDVDGDGLLDVVINDGWYQQPKQPPKTLKTHISWKLHRGKFSQERGGAQMFVLDVDADGDNDVVSAKHAHEWGLAWYEQMPLKNGSARFREHTIMGSGSETEQYGIAFSQPHAMTVADIDGDGKTDLITGKRRWAHGPEGDIEPNAPPVVVWFQLQRSANGTASFKPHIIDDNSGVGVQIQALDVNQDGRIDVLTASKLGTFVFLQNAR